MICKECAYKVIAISQTKVTFFDYLTYFTGSDKKQELVAGELIQRSLATGKHGAIMTFLKQTFDTEIEHFSYLG